MKSDTDGGYNGWANRETWLVVIHIQNNPDAYARFVRRFVRGSYAHWDFDALENSVINWWRTWFGHLPNKRWAEIREQQKSFLIDALGERVKNFNNFERKEYHQIEDDLLDFSRKVRWTEITKAVISGVF